MKYQINRTALEPRGCERKDSSVDESPARQREVNKILGLVVVYTNCAQDRGEIISSTFISIDKIYCKNSPTRLDHYHSIA